MQGVKGEAVVNYAEPLTTQQMRYHRLSRRVRNTAVFPCFLDITGGGFFKVTHNFLKERLLLFLKTFCRLFYAMLGLTRR